MPSHRCRCAVETTTSQPSGGLGSPPRSTSIPSSEPMKIVSRSVPAAYLGPERAGDVRVRRHPGAADADEVEPAPLRGPCARFDDATPVSGGQARSPLRRSGRPRRHAPSRASPRASRRAARGSASSSLDERRHRADLGVGHDDGAAAPLEVPRVERLVVGRRVRIRHEDRRRPRGRELPHGASGPRDGDVGRGEHVAEVLRLRHQHVARRDARAARAPR